VTEHFKLAGNEFLQILQLIFNRIFEERNIPKSYKTGIITPIAKREKTLAIPTVIEELL
jgi:hypothetical protein